MQIPFQSPFTSRTQQALLVVLLAIAPSTQAQTAPPTPAPSGVGNSHIRLLLDGGTATFLLNQIRAVTLHSYLVEGVGEAVECTVDVGGSTTTRLYTVKPLEIRTPLGVGQSVVDRATQLADEARSKIDAGGLTRRVVKNYPLTTHSHTVEYVLEDRAAVESAFSKIETAWLRQRGGEIDLRSLLR